jgi:hypothetical protein
MRGTGFKEQAADQRARFSPAHAGNGHARVFVERDTGLEQQLVVARPARLARSVEADTGFADPDQQAADGRPAPV